MVDWDGLENRCAFTGTVGSNPTLSAMPLVTIVCQSGSVSLAIRRLSVTLPTMLLPTFTQMLTALSTWLDKAAAEKGADADALMAARLAPDMFPLATQVRFACVQAQEALYRLQGQPFPASLTALLDEARGAGDAPGTIAAAKTRIAETVALIEAVDPAAIAVEPDQPIVHDLPIGLTFDFSALSYARDWALAQFYFHIMIAYAILRHEGVALGKADYVAHLMPFIRPQAASPA